MCSCNDFRSHRRILREDMVGGNKRAVMVMVLGGCHLNLGSTVTAH